MKKELCDLAQPRPRKLPLEHIRAVVLTQAWAGAYTTMLLADMGAEVIQIESLDRPDPWRGGYPPRVSGTYPGNQPGDRPYNRAASFNSVNTNKFGITLDLNTIEGKGCDGPYSTYMGNGGTTEPMSGLSSLMGYGDDPPMNSGIMHTDPVAGLYGLSSLLIALHHRNRTGEGQLIDLSQQETSVHLMAYHVMDNSMNGSVHRHKGNRDGRMAPHGNFPCDSDDSWVAIAIRSDREWQRLCAVMGKAELATDQRFSGLEARLHNVDELERLIVQWTRGRKAYDIMSQLQAEHIPCAPVLNAHEVLENAQLKERGFFDRVDHPETGTHLHAGTPWRIAGAPSRVRTPAPALGQHSGQILSKLLGVSSGDLASLVERGITGDTPRLDD